MPVSKEELLKAAISRHGEENQKKFQAATVAICGLGGLGSNIASSLARIGIGRLLLIDFDTVDITNLHRQQYKASQIGKLKTEALKENLYEIAPYIELETYSERLDENNFARILANANIICEAFDDANAKAMLADAVLTQFPDKYLISSSGMAGFLSANEIKTRKITDKFYLCGDEISDVNAGVGLISSRVMVCAAHQAHMAVRIIIGERLP